MDEFQGMVPLASYDDAVQANRIADFLRKEGIHCVVNLADLGNWYMTTNREHKGILILVEPEDELFAHSILDEIEDTGLNRPAGKADTYVLAGGVTSTVGVLATLGQYGDETSFVLTLAYGLIFGGGAFFLRGLMKSREESKHEGLH
ncbi:MAG: hypothetical protein AAF587_21855 [Bacteroidota bacterium]